MLVIKVGGSKGIDLDLFEGPYEARDGLAEATLSTQRLGLYRPGGSGGFITGIAYRDTTIRC